MKNKTLEMLGGKMCNTCKYYDIMTGYCSKTQKHHHHLDYVDENPECWRIAPDLIEHRPKRKKEYEQLKLL